MKKTQKRTIIFGGLFIIILCVIGIGVKKVTEPTQYEQQVAFLKEHAGEIIKKAFEIDGEMTAKDINFDWATVKVEESGVIAPEPYALSVKVSSTSTHDNRKYRDILIIKTNINKLDKIDSVSFK